MITLCILADTHQKHRQVTIPPCDLLIHCGDFGYFERADRATLRGAHERVGESDDGDAAGPVARRERGDD